MAKKSVTEGLKTRIKNLAANNESLKKATALAKRAATKETGQLLAVGGLAAGGGAVAGYTIQEKINAAEGLPDIAKAIGPVPSGAVAGVALALYGAFKLKGQTQAAVAGFGGGLAGGAWLQGPPA